MMRLLRPLVALGALAISAASFAWIDTGHMVVAAIAEDRLANKVYDECQRLLKIGGTDKTRDFLGAACWADDTKTKENGPWHYIDIPYRPDGKPSTKKIPDENVVWAINHFGEILKDKSKPDSERADALRYLIHFVGDIHQPLHATELEDEAHPDGDKGGNDIKIKAQDMFPNMERPPTNLHFLWDIGAGIFMPGVAERPLNPESKARIHIMAVDLTAKYREKSFGELTKDLDPMDWAKESNRVARDFVYKIKTGGDIDLTYITIAKTYAGERATLAGYRLAALLNKLLG